MPKPLDPVFLQRTTDAPTQAVTVHVAALRQKAIEQAKKAKDQAVSEANRLGAYGQIEKIEKAFDKAIACMDRYKLGTETGQVAIKYLQDVETNIQKTMTRTGKRSKASILIGYGTAETDSVQAKLHKAQHIIRNTLLVNQDFYVSGRRKLMGTILSEGTRSPRMKFTHRFKLFSRDRERALSTRKRFKKLQSDIHKVMESRMKKGPKTIGPDPDEFFKLYAEIASLRAMITAQGANTNTAAYEALDIMTDQLAAIEQQEAIDKHGFVDFLAKDGQVDKQGACQKLTESQQRAAAFLKQLNTDRDIDPNREISGKDRPKSTDLMVKLACTGDHERNIMVTVAQVILKNRRNKSLKMQDGTVSDRITFMKTAMALGATKVEMIGSSPSDYHLVSAKKRREYDQLTVVCAALRDLPAACLTNIDKMGPSPHGYEFEHLLEIANQSHDNMVMNALWIYCRQHKLTSDDDGKSICIYESKQHIKDLGLTEKLLTELLTKNFPGGDPEHPDLDEKAARFLNACPGNGLLQRAMLLPPGLRTAFRKAVHSITSIDSPALLASMEHGDGASREVALDPKKDLMADAGSARKPSRTNLTFGQKPSPPHRTAQSCAYHAGGGRSAGGPPIPPPAAAETSPLKRERSARRVFGPTPVRSASPRPTPPPSNGTPPSTPSPTSSSGGSSTK